MHCVQRGQTMEGGPTNHYLCRILGWWFLFFHITPSPGICLIDALPGVWEKLYTCLRHYVFSHKTAIASMRKAVQRPLSNHYCALVPYTTSTLHYLLQGCIILIPTMFLQIQLLIQQCLEAPSNYRSLALKTTNIADALRAKRTNNGRRPH